MTAESNAPSGLGRIGVNCLSKVIQRCLFAGAKSFLEFDIHTPKKKKTEKQSLHKYCVIKDENDLCTFYKLEAS